MTVPSSAVSDSDADGLFVQAVIAGGVGEGSPSAESAAPSARHGYETAARTGSHKVTLGRPRRLDPVALPTFA